jgi:hypothetical protein
LRQDTYEAKLGDLSNLNKYVYVGNNPITNVDWAGLFLGNINEFTLTEKLRADLETQYRLPAAIGTYGRIKSSLIVVAGAVAAALGVSAAMSQQAAKNLNRQFGIPVVFWGNDLPEITEHQFKSITGSGYTLHNNSGAIGQSLPISPALHRYGAGYSRGWLYSQPQSSGRSSSLGLDTDEFPYAKTIEGGSQNYQKGLVSLHVLNASQNRSNGSRLNIFWNIPTVGVKTYETSRTDSLFLNVPVPGLGASFGLDRNNKIVPV